MDNPRAALPAIHRLLAHRSLAPLVESLGRVPVRDAARGVLADARRDLRPGTEPPSADELAAAVARRLAERADAYPEVVNATGVLIHTNLGRAPRTAAPLPPYLALEIDVAEGRRGERLAPVVDRLLRYFGAEAGTVVTNNAAALVLLLAAHATGREVIVSRGELIEIGGSFRLPDVMTAAGARLREVGCTNRTHLADYEHAVGEDTAAILVAHRSNFHLSGFVAAPALADLVELGRRRGIPVWVDQGSGCHLPLERYGLRHEETVAEILHTGADAVLFSGDKLLGGPQAGIVLGRESTVAPLRRHPLRRALRPDKSVLAALAATLDAFIADRPEDVPLYDLLGVTENELARRARRLARRLSRGGVDARAVPCRAVIGGGSMPDETVASWAVELPGEERVARRLREGRPPVLGRIESGRVLLDLRAVFPDQDLRLAAAVLAALSS